MRRPTTASRSTKEMLKKESARSFLITRGPRQTGLGGTFDESSSKVVHFRETARARVSGPEPYPA